MMMMMMTMMTRPTAKIINLGSVQCDTSLESQDQGDLESDDDNNDDDDDVNADNKNHNSL